MTDIRNVPLPDLVAGVVDDVRELIEAQVSSLKSDLGDRVGDLTIAIRSWLVAVCVAIVTTVLFGVAAAATLTQLAGVPWFASFWIVTAVALCTVAALVYRARTSGRRAARGAKSDLEQAIDPMSPDPDAVHEDSTMTLLRLHYRGNRGGPANESEDRSSTLEPRWEAR